MATISQPESIRPVNGWMNSIKTLYAKTSRALMRKAEREGLSRQAKKVKRA
ncbi:hypothetical protein IMCC1989_1387 [gamma proteobacterium IMCC1989]|nr:hypothetical protein IMCC1989_1387 [gamma proteobacterium IMCC1989]